MEESALDAWYLWIGVSLASIAVLGVVAGLPTATGPDAVAVAEAVDAVASSDQQATTRVRLRADRIRLGPYRVALRSSGGGTAHATFAYGPVTPTRGRPGLRGVLAGRPPDTVFRSRSAFATAVRRARSDGRAWRRAPAELTVRRVVWGDVDVTLVG
ncbi:MAG: hypothetical protein ABEI96_06030 [Haloarculaceae archaeon]